MNYPKVGQVYTLAEIKELSLRDSACLSFVPQNVRYVWSDKAERQSIQTSHIGYMSAIEGWSETKWKYIRETYEWIPIFHAVDDKAIQELCVVAAHTDSFHRDRDEMHVYPKGTECKQYYEMTPEVAAFIETYECDNY